MYSVFRRVRFLLVVTMLLCTTSFRFLQPRRHVTFSRGASKMMQHVEYPQSLDATSISLTVSELQFLKPSKVENIFQEDAFSLYIGLRTDQLHWLHITWHSKFSWLTLAPSPARSKSQRLSLESTLTSFLQDTYLTDLSVPDQRNRVVKLGFSDKLSQSPKYSLYVEMMGAKSNIALVDARSSLILACGYQVSAGRLKGGRDTTRTSVRALQVSGKYEPPPAFVTDNDLTDLPDLTRKLTEGPLSYYGTYSILLRSSPAISPNIAHSMLSAAGLEGTESVQPLSDSQVRTIAQACALWNASYSDQTGIIDAAPSDTLGIQVTPHYFQVTDRDGSPKSFFSPVQFVPAKSPVTIASASAGAQTSRVVEFLRDYYASAYRSYLFGSLRSECERLLSRRLEKGDRLLSKLEAMERERACVDSIDS